MERRAKQLLGVIGIVTVILFPVLFATDIGEVLGISPVSAAFGVIIIYFLIGQLWKRKDMITG